MKKQTATADGKCLEAELELVLCEELTQYYHIIPFNQRPNTPTFFIPKKPLTFTAHSLERDWEKNGVAFNGNAKKNVFLVTEW